MQTEQGTNEVIETMSHFMTLARGRRDLSKLKQDTIITWLRRRYAETHPDDYAEYQRRFGMHTRISVDEKRFSVKHPTGDQVDIVIPSKPTIQNPRRITWHRDGVTKVDCIMKHEMERLVDSVLALDWLTGDEQAFLLKHLTGVYGA